MQPLLWQLFFRLAFEVYHGRFAVHLFLSEEARILEQLEDKLKDIFEFHDSQMVCGLQGLPHEWIVLRL